MFYGRNGSPLPMTRRQIAAAREICRACPVQRDCLAEAVEDGEELGIWGGYTGPERARAIALFDPAPLITDPTDRRHRRKVPDPDHQPSGRVAVDGVMRAFDTDTLAAAVIRL